jgi:DNA repair protein RecN (Recombination protein N)
LEFTVALVVFLEGMLRQVRIKDFAIIDTLTIRFEPGLNVLTGETGAGKSIIIDAFGLTLGERAQSDMIKTGRHETIIEAYFDIPAHPLIAGLGIPIEDGIILRRHLLSGGKSRAFVNDTMVNVQTLLDIGRSLVDIHGQHEHQSLLSTETQRAMIDAYGKLLGERAEIETLFHEVQSMSNELSSLKSTVRERGQRMDLLSYQIQEISSASLEKGEKEALIEERSILTNLVRLNELTDTAYLLLHSGESSSTEKLSSAISMVREMSQLDRGVAEVLHILESAMPLVEDAALSLRNYKDRYDADPKRLDMVEDRLDLIQRLERKYGEGIDGILHYLDGAERELEKLTLSDEKVKEMEDELKRREGKLFEAAQDLSAQRRNVSKKVEQAVRVSLKDLAMERAEFVIDVKPMPLCSLGADAVEFLFSANKGEIPKPLSRTASGGELSRIMLALKGILAEVDHIPVLIFDEVDAGIGGRTAESIGMKLKNLAKRHQVLCITHLPQIAAMADHHIMIEKMQKKESVYVTVKELSRKEREEEIARMLSGKITEISLRHARELLGSVA